MWNLLLAATFAFSTSTLHQLMQQPASTGASATTRLDDSRDRFRPLLVFAADDKDKQFIEQVQRIAESASQLHERQVLFVPLLERSETRSWAKAIDPFIMAYLSADDAAAARRKYRVPFSEFTVILVGKDGGEKFRTHSPVTIKELNTVIDAMPMRQQEIQDGHAH